MVYEIPPGGGGKPYPASGLLNNTYIVSTIVTQFYQKLKKTLTNENESRTSSVNHSLLIIT